MRPVALILLLGATGALTGCGTSASDAVRAKVDQLATAAAAHDYRTLCQQVLAPSLIERLSSAGVSCEQGMAIAFGPVQQPSLSIGKVTVHGSQASVIVLSTARNQLASVDSVELQQTSHGWRVSALASPIAAASHG
jgi:hypothetical protein